MVKINRVPLNEQHPIYFIVGLETYFTSSKSTSVTWSSPPACGA